MWEIAIAVLLAVVAVLLYKILMMKSACDNTLRINSMAPGIGVGRKVSGIESDSLLDTEVNERMHGMEDKLSSMEKKVRSNDELVKRLVRELGK
jgi:hypothetical protein